MCDTANHCYLCIKQNKFLACDVMQSCDDHTTVKALAGDYKGETFKVYPDFVVTAEALASISPDERESLLKLKLQLSDKMVGLRSMSKEAVNGMSGLLYARYESLQVAGFEKQQAFEIVKHRGLL